MARASSRLFGRKVSISAAYGARKRILVDGHAHQFFPQIKANNDPTGREVCGICSGTRPLLSG